MTVDVAIPNLAAMIAASNVFLQEIKASLGGYLKTSGAPVASVEELLASGLHVAQLQGILDIANRTADDYFESDEHRRAPRGARNTGAGGPEGHGRQPRRRARVSGREKNRARRSAATSSGSNEALSPQTGFPAMNVPAGFTPGGFPVGMELLGRPFAEATLIAIAYRSSRRRATGVRRRRP